MITVENISTILSFALIIGGFISIIFPIAPSIPLVWLGIFVYGISHKYEKVDPQFIAVVSAVALVTLLLDYTLSKSGAQKMRVGGWGVFGAIVGGAVGSFFGPVFGFIVGPMLGGMMAEMLRGRDHVYSYQQGHYTVVGFMGGTIVKLLAAIVMAGLFVLRLQGKF